MEKNTISKATLGRLPQYLGLLRTLPQGEDDRISATAIARRLSLGEVQVRKDLNAASGQGKPRTGYQTRDLIRSLERSLGFDQNISAVLVGAGKLGRALLEYDEFSHYGMQIVAAFDCNERPLPYSRNAEILPMRDFVSFCKSHGVQIGIITVGKGSAQSVCDLMVESGITAIWNFAPCQLEVPEGILIKPENLALSLAHLGQQLYRE
ncbi:MAG: redox-sensing transcriptional repressor Rex [Clostridia bacterium]|nr:redox-sensing transcriptional repressor Rex [Clostridia bacterium]